MQTEFKLPELGENIDSGSVVKVLVSVGDKIEKDQAVLELETDKATIEVPSSVSGVVRQIHVQEGGKAEVGQVVLTLDSDAQAAEPAKKSGQDSSKKTSTSAAEEKPKEKAPADEKSPQPSAAKQEDVQKHEPAEKKEEQTQAVSPPTTPAPAETVEVKLPELGEGIETATVVKALVSEGSSVAIDQPVLELETDKATFELPSDAAGTVKKIHVKEGDQAKVGQTVLTLEGATRKEKSDVKRGAGLSEKDQKVAGHRMKALEGQLESGAEREVAKSEPAEKQVREPSTLQVIRPEELPQVTKQVAPAAPSVRRLAREIGVDINQVRGSGPRGRISIDDIKKHARQINQQRAPGIVREVPALPDFSRWGPIERAPMNNVRLKTAQHLTIAWNNVPAVTQYDKSDITQLEEERKQFGSKVEGAGGKLTVTAILVKVLASALKTFPQFNASADISRNEIIYKKYYHIGVAVNTDRGLLVPVVRDVDRKNILVISVELAELAEKARKKKLTLEEMQGGTFTITNLGGIGGTGFSPIVNYPEVAILGVSRSSVEPVYKNDKFEPRLMLPLSLSYDHRIIDGADAARFLRWVAETLQDPFVLALEG